jgi:hypothetical protein
LPLQPHPAPQQTVPTLGAVNEGQTALHRVQFFGSLDVSTQLPAQLVNPPEHEQAPPWQVPPVQAAPFIFVGLEQTPLVMSHVPAMWHSLLAVQAPQH